MLSTVFEYYIIVIMYVTEIDVWGKVLQKINFVLKLAGFCFLHFLYHIVPLNWAPTI